MEMNAEIQAGMDMMKANEFDEADTQWKKLKAVFHKKEGVLAQMHDYKSASTECAHEPRRVHSLGLCHPAGSLPDVRAP